MWSTPTASSESAPRYRKIHVVRSAIVDLPSGRAQRVPVGAELIETLAVHVAGLAVADVVVEGVPRVGDLALAAVRWDRADLRADSATASARLAGRGQGRPDAQAGAR